MVLMNKHKPPKQRGKLNGVGGSVELNDKSPRAAMVREFAEETGLATSEEQWKAFCTFINADASEVIFFICNDDRYREVTTAESEPVIIVDYPLSPANKKIIMPNLSWLLPLGLDRTTRGVIAHEYGG